MAEVLQFPILDVQVEAAGSAPDLRYVWAFAGAYEQPAERNGAGPTARVEVVRDRGSAETGGAEVWVHRSKHAYWDVRGRRSDAGAVRWLSRPVTTARSGETDAVVVTPPDATAEMTGEAAWHVCRSMALYLRQAGRGKLLHASAVCFGDRAVLFLGDVSAGKTTFLTDAVFDHGARPLANDRVVVTTRPPLRAHSWPSYASFTEGTLLDRPALHDAALAYEDGTLGHRTQVWGRDLARRYTKDAKRVYPMAWFVHASGRPYAWSGSLAALVISTLSPEVDGRFVRRLDLADPQVRSEVEEIVDHECFDELEPSFCPWHGLTLPSGAPSASELVDSLERERVPVYRLAADPADRRPALEAVLAAAL